MSNTDRADQNSEYVRRLLRNKSPEFAAALERAVWELTCTCGASSEESRVCDLLMGTRILGVIAAVNA